MSKQARYSRRVAATAADIGRIPEVGNPTRRAACRDDLFRFLTTYFPNSTGLSPFSEDHRRVISRTERSLHHGGYFVNAVYRGFAKTTMAQNASVWAALYGHRRYVAIFGSDAEAAATNIDSIKLELSENPLLAEDFPEACHPVASLENKPQRCQSQTYTRDCPDCGGGGECDRCGGTGEVRELTHIGWTAERIVLPSIAGSPSSGVILTSRGLTAGSRGMVHKRPGGTQQRPDFVLIDDPQTDESASTAHQVGKRLDVIRKSILKLGGHGRKISVVMNATVIRREDLDGQRKAHADATAFYLANRAAMDKGCIVSWAHCYDPEAERSAIQHAYNALIDDGADVFASEYQNEPMADKQDEGLLKAAEVAAKVNNLGRGRVPLGAELVTVYIDVQGKLLWWLAAAWRPDMTGSVIDYGSWPDQQRSYFTLSDATRTLQQRYKGAGIEGAVHGGLTDLVAELTARAFRREDGADMKVGRILIDAADGDVTSTVKAFCRRSAHAAILLPSFGRGIGASAIPMDQYTRKVGETIGDHWMLPSLKGKAASAGGRYLLIDTNHWKTHVHAHLGAAVGDRGGITLWGKRPEEHRMLSEHLTAEYFVATEGRGRKLKEWKVPPSRPDNHWLDCLVGTAVAASMGGCRLGVPGSPAAKRSTPPAAPRRRKTTYYNN